MVRGATGFDRVDVLTTPPGDSAVQRRAEGAMIAALGAQLGFKLEPCRLTIADGATVAVDGYSADPPVLAEAWAHQGPPKGGQRNKVLAGSS